MKKDAVARTIGILSIQWPHRCQFDGLEAWCSCKRFRKAFKYPYQVFLGIDAHYEAMREKDGVRAFKGLFKKDGYEDNFVTVDKNDS